MQLLRQGSYRCVDQRGAALLIELGNDDLARGRNRDVDGNSADFGERLSLFLRDPLLRQPAAPLQCLLEVARRLRGDAFGFGLRMGDDRFGPRRGLALLLLVSGECLVGFVAKSPRCFELVSDTHGAGVQPPITNVRTARRTQTSGSAKTCIVSLSAPPSRGRPPGSVLPHRRLNRSASP